MIQLFHADKNDRRLKIIFISYIPQPRKHIMVKELGLPHQNHFYSSWVISLRWSSIIIYAIISPCLCQKYFKKHHQMHASTRESGMKSFVAKSSIIVHYISNVLLVFTINKTVLFQDFTRRIQIPRLLPKIFKI